MSGLEWTRGRGAPWQRGAGGVNLRRLQFQVGAAHLLRGYTDTKHTTLGGKKITTSDNLKEKQEDFSLLFGSREKKFTCARARSGRS